MLMSEAGSCFDVAADYHVRLPDGDHLLVIAGGKAPFDFDHPNVAARVPHVWEFKHYHPIRGKWWTQQAGVDLYFVIAKHKIELPPEKGYSYVPVVIGGTRFRLNVSGGTGDGWTDYVSSQVRTQVGLPKSRLAALASVACSQQEVMELGLGFDVPSFSDEDRSSYRELAVRPLVQQAQIKRLMLGRYVSCMGKKGPFDIISTSRRHRRFVVGQDGWQCRIKYSQIDWLQTAALNDIEVPEPTTLNRVGSIIKSE